MHPLIEQYGKEFTSELLDIILIKQENIDTDIELLLKKYEVISRRSRATLRSYLRKNTWTHHQSLNEATGRYERVPLDEPYDMYTVFTRNGRNEQVFLAQFKSIELPQIMEELK